MDALKLDSHSYRLPPIVPSPEIEIAWITPSTAEPTFAIVDIGVPVGLAGHALTVGVTITPFRHSKHRGHVFFSAAASYIKCCPLVNSEHLDSVRERTRQVLQVFFPQICCDFGDSSCFGDATKTANLPFFSCQSSAKQASEYFLTSWSNTDKESLVVDQEEVANAIVSAIHANADTKTRARTLRELEISLPRRQDGQTYVQFMNKFERTCQSLREESTARTHTLQFLAGCIRQAAPHLPPIKAPISGDNSLCNDVSISSKTRTYWQCRAETANAIVDGLLVAWGTTALSLYHVLAAQSAWFRRLRGQASERRREVVAMVVARLRDNPPEQNKEANHGFHPEFEMAQVLSLPLAATAGILLTSDQLIPPLFYAMGGHVPKILIDRATTSQKRLGKDGKVCDLAPEAAGLDPGLACLLSNKSKLQQSIQRLTAFSVLSLEDSVNGLASYICQRDSVRVAFDSDRSYWTCQAFELLCYIFPRSEIVDPCFQPAGKLLVGFLDHILPVFSETGLEIPCTRNVAEALLAASNFGNIRHRQDVLTAAAGLQRAAPQIDLGAETAHRQSVFLRLVGRISDSESVLHAVLGSARRRAMIRSPIPHPLFGRLHLSRANNYVYQFQFTDADEELRKWLPLEDFSEEQFEVLWSQTYCRARVLKGLGRFSEAKDCLESCLCAYDLTESKRLLIQSTLADLYCELDYRQSKAHQTLEGYFAPGSGYLGKGEAIIRPQVEQARQYGSRSKSFRRLLLSLLEIEVRSERYREAELLANEALDLYHDLAYSDIVDRLGHVRVLIALARISPLAMAEQRWLFALDQNKLYNPSEEDVFTSGLIYLFVSSVNYKIGNPNRGFESLRRAGCILDRRKPQFLIPGVGTYLFDFVRMELEQFTRRE